MAKNPNSVFNALMKFAEGNSSSRVFIAPDIPTKKLVNAQSRYITRDEPIAVLIDDTLFGSAKDGLAISENYIYAKGVLAEIKSVKISSIRSVSSQSNKLGPLDIYFGGNFFVTLSTIEKSDHYFIIKMLEAAYAASQPSAANSLPKVSKAPKVAAPGPKLEKSDVSRDTLTCTECSCSLPATAKFCLECGTKVIPKGICRECNTMLPKNAKFCLECGTQVGRLTSQIVTNSADEARSVNVKTTIFQREEKSRSNSKIAEQLEGAIGSVTAVRERVLAGVAIEAGEDMYDWLLEVSVTISDLLDQVDQVDQG